MNQSESVQLIDYVRAVRRRWALVALMTVVATGIALAISLSADKQYDATAELLLRDQEAINTILQPNTDQRADDPERELNTNVELIKVGAVAHAVRRELGLPRSTDTLLDQITTETSSSSDIVELTARDRNPRAAAAIANSFATQYESYRLRSARLRYEQAAQLASSQLAALPAAERASEQGRELEGRRRELEIAAALQTGGVQIVRRASVPDDPARPRPKLSAALGLMLGLLLGVGVALARELFDRRLKDEEEIEDFTALPILAAIPRPARRAAGRVEDHAQSEAYGLLAANLRFSTLHRESNVLMVTSASPAEGKTSVTLGMARALARLGLRVIAIEADLRRPTFTKVGTLPPSAGLAGVLSGSTRLSQELVWLDAATLEVAGGEEPRAGSSFAVLPAGELPPDPQRALADAAVEEVVRSARALADVVLIDTAPIGTVNDPAALARVVDSIALVVRLNGTTKDAARRALRVLRSLDVPLAGVVVTGAEVSRSHGYYPAATAKPEPVAVEDRRG